MSGKGNASLNRGRSAVDVTMDSNDDGTENVNTPQPALEVPPSQQNEPIENDDESDDEDDIPFYQYTFSSDGQVEGYGTPSPQALNIASLLGNFLATRLAEQRAAASDPVEECEDGNPAASSSNLVPQEGKGMGKTAAKTKAAPKKKSKKPTKGSSKKKY